MEKKMEFDKEHMVRDVARQITDMGFFQETRKARAKSGDGMEVNVGVRLLLLSSSSNVMCRVVCTARATTNRVGRWRQQHEDGAHESGRAARLVQSGTKYFA
jgi:hypothetical protein